MSGLDQRVVVGTMNFGRVTNSDDAERILLEASELGISVINTADTDYSGASEAIVGRHIQRTSPQDRPRLLVEISGPDMNVPHDPDLTPGYLRSAVERALDRLGVDSVYRVVLPRPSFRIPLEETLVGAYERIVDGGLAESLGVSTFPAWLTCHGQHVCRDRGLPAIASELAPYNLLDRRLENEILPNASFWKMEVFAWGALAQGVLAGRYSEMGPLPPDSRPVLLGGLYAERVALRARRVGSAFVHLAREFGYEPSSAAVAWCLAQGGVSGAVVGPRRPGQLTETARARDLRLESDFLERANSLVPPGSAVADFFNSAPWMLESVGTKHESEDVCSEV